MLFLTIASSENRNDKVTIYIRKTSGDFVSYFACRNLDHGKLLFNELISNKAFTGNIIQLVKNEEVLLSQVNKSKA